MFIVLLECVCQLSLIKQFPQFILSINCTFRIEYINIICYTENLINNYKEIYSLTTKPYTLYFFQEEFIKFSSEKKITYDNMILPNWYIFVQFFWEDKFSVNGIQRPKRTHYKLEMTQYR